MAGVRSKKGSIRIQLDLRHKNPKLWAEKTQSDSAGLSLSDLSVLWGMSRVLWYVCSKRPWTLQVLSALLPKHHRKSEIMRNKNCVLWRALLGRCGTKYTHAKIVSLSNKLLLQVHTSTFLLTVPEIPRSI